MTLSRAIIFSVLLHCAAWVLFVYAHARSEIGGLARPPTSDTKARIYSYQMGTLVEAATSEAPPSTVDSIASSGGTAMAAVKSDGDSAALAADRKDTHRADGPHAAVHAKAETIFDQAALDTSPVVLSNVVLEYPAAANNREGVVSLEIVILGTGEVETVKVLKAVPAGIFEAAAIAGFKNAKFSPGLLGGYGVKSRMDVEVEFMPTNRGGAVAGQK